MPFQLPSIRYWISQMSCSETRFYLQPDSAQLLDDLLNETGFSMRHNVVTEALKLMLDVTDTYMRGGNATVYDSGCKTDLAQYIYRGPRKTDIEKRSADTWINFNFNRKSIKYLDFMVESTGASGYDELLEQALKLYAFVRSAYMSNGVAIMKINDHAADLAERIKGLKYNKKSSCKILRYPSHKN